MNGTATDAFASVNGDALQVATFLGVLITIGISWSSLNQQRAAAARESLEQIDDLEVRRPNAKIKPILHKYRPWPYSESTVKLQSYGKTDIADVSRIPSRFLAFPRHVFGDYDVEIVEDGFLIKYNTSDPVEIRRNTQEILREMSESSGDRDYGHGLVGFEEIETTYSYYSSGELADVHEQILEMFENDDKLDISTIRNNMSDKWYDINLAYILLGDLIQMGEIKQDSDTGEFLLTSEQSKS